MMFFVWELESSSSSAKNTTDVILEGSNYIWIFICHALTFFSDG